MMNHFIIELYQALVFALPCLAAIQSPDLDQAGSYDTLSAP